MSLKKEEYGMTCYFAVKNDGVQQFNKRAACRFLTKEKHFLPSKTQVNCGNSYFCKTAGNKTI